MIRPGPKEGKRSFQAVKPAPGSDRGGRPPAPDLPVLRGGGAAAPQMAQAPPAVDPLAAYGRWALMDDPAAPKPEYFPGQENYNPFERRWIQ